MTYDLEEFKNDNDWQCAFYEAVNGCFKDWNATDRGPIENVTRICAAIAGENDSEDWLAIVEWAGPQGAFCTMSAGCDYTGWDCQAGGTADFYDTEDLAVTDLTPEQAQRLGLFHDSFAYKKHKNDIYAEIYGAAI